MTIPVFPQLLANQLAAQYQSANSLSNNPFRVSPITLVYIAYAVIFGIPAACSCGLFFVSQGHNIRRIIGDRQTETISRRKQKTVRKRVFVSHLNHSAAFLFLHM